MVRLDWREFKDECEDLRKDILDLAAEHMKTERKELETIKKRMKMIRIMLKQENSILDGAYDN